MTWGQIRFYLLFPLVALFILHLWHISLYGLGIKQIIHESLVTQLFFTTLHRNILPRIGLVHICMVLALTHFRGVTLPTPVTVTPMAATQGAFHARVLSAAVFTKRIGGTIYTAVLSLPVRTSGAFHTYVLPFAVGTPVAFYTVVLPFTMRAAFAFYTVVLPFAMSALGVGHDYHWFTVEKNP